MGSLNLSDYKKIYLDTSLYIYFFEDNKQFASQVEMVFTNVIDASLVLVASELLFTELLVLPFRVKDQKMIDLYLRLPSYFPNFESLPLSHDIAIMAANLRAKYGLRTPDAIHLATAIQSNADVFFCADKQLTKVQEIKVVCL